MAIDRLESLRSPHREILLKFAALRGEILERPESLKGRRGGVGLPPDEFVPARHRLHDVVRGIYKPRGWDTALSVLLTESESNYGHELRYRNSGDWECQYRPPNRKRDARAKSDIQSLTRGAVLRIPVGVIRRLEPSRYEVLGLGTVWTGRRAFGIMPYNPSVPLRQAIDAKIGRQVEARVESGDYSLPDKRGTRQVRVAQQLFRKLMSANYRHCCAFCGWTASDFLTAAHIVRWVDDPANRLNPSNGLLLCRLCDMAFERGLIQINDNLGLTVDTSLALAVSNHTVGKAWLFTIRSASVRAERWPPDLGFIAAHRKRCAALKISDSALVSPDSVDFQPTNGVSTGADTAG